MNNKNNFKIKFLRNKIDILDRQIINLLDKRLEISLKIAKEKKTNNIRILDKSREKDIILKLKKLKKNHLSDRAIEKIYEQILSNSVDTMKKTNYLK